MFVTAHQHDEEAVIISCASDHMRVLGYFCLTDTQSMVRMQAAFRLYMQAQILPGAQYHVGRCYDHGVGTTKDKPAAIIWYTKVLCRSSAVTHDVVMADWPLNQHMPITAQDDFGTIGLSTPMTGNCMADDAALSKEKSHEWC